MLGKGWANQDVSDILDEGQVVDVRAVEFLSDNIIRVESALMCEDVPAQSLIIWV